MAEPTSSSGFLTLLNESLSFAPDRTDLWMTRFDILRSLGHKKEFAQIVGEAVANPKILRELDWNGVRRMWAEIAPNDPFPGPEEKAKAPPVLASTLRAALAPAAPAEPAMPDVAAPAAAPRRPAPVSNARRRCNDIAVKIGGPELSALSREYNQVALRPWSLEDFTKRARKLRRRPTPLQYSGSLSRAAGPGMRVYLKREDGRGVPAEAEHAAAQCYIAAQLGK